MSGHPSSLGLCFGLLFGLGHCLGLSLRLTVRPGWVEVLLGLSSLVLVKCSSLKTTGSRPWSITCYLGGLRDHIFVRIGYQPTGQFKHLGSEESILMAAILQALCCDVLPNSPNLIVQPPGRTARTPCRTRLGLRCFSLLTVRAQRAEPILAGHLQSIGMLRFMATS